MALSPETIVDRESLFVFLQSLSFDQQRQVSLAIATRCALRVVPLLGEVYDFIKIEDRIDMTFLSLECIAISQLAIRHPNLKIKNPDHLFSFATGSASDSAAYASDAATSLAYAAAFDDDFIDYAADSADFAANSVDDFASMWINIREDISMIRAGSSISQLMHRPLWKTLPTDFEVVCVDFRDSLVTFSYQKPVVEGAPWLVWWEWYEPQIMGGIPWNLPQKISEIIENRIALGDNREDFWNRDPHVITGEIHGWVEEARRELIEEQKGISPVIPAELDGQAWVVDPITNLLNPISKASTKSDTEIADMESLRPYLLNCAEELVTELRSSLSNSAKQLLPRAENYFESINKHSSEISIPSVYSAGTRLRNMQDRIRQDTESEGMPNVATDIGEAMDSVIGLHGPFILATKRGQELQKRAQDDNRTKVQELAYKNNALKFSDALQKSKGILSQQGKIEIQEANNEIAVGSHPERSTQLAEYSNHNLLRTTASFIALEYATAVMSNTQLANTLIGGGTAFVENATLWLLSNATMLVALAATSPEVLGWLPHYLRWLKLQFAKRN